MTLPIDVGPVTLRRWSPARATMLERNGFTLEGVHRNAIYKDGEFVDLLVLSLLRSEVQ